MNIDSVGSDIVHIFENSAFILAHIHNGAYEIGRNINMSIGERLLAIVNISRVRIVCRIVNLNHCAVGKMNFINNARNGCDKVEIILTVEPFLNNFEVQKSQKTASEAKAECTRSFRLI